MPELSALARPSMWARTTRRTKGIERQSTASVRQCDCSRRGLNTRWASTLSRLSCRLSDVLTVKGCRSAQEQSSTLTASVDTTRGNLIKCTAPIYGPPLVSPPIGYTEILVRTETGMGPPSPGSSWVWLLKLCNFVACPKEPWFRSAPHSAADPQLQTHSYLYRVYTPKHETTPPPTPQGAAVRQHEATHSPKGGGAQSRLARTTAWPGGVSAPYIEEQIDGWRYQSWPTAGCFSGCSAAGNIGCTNGASARLY